MYFDVTKATYDAGRNVQSMKLERWFQTRGDFVSQGRLVVPRRGGVALLTSAVAAAAKSLQLFLTLCDPRDGSSSGSSVPGILQARILEWVAISFSNACTHTKSLQSYLTLCVPVDSAHQAPLPTGFSRQEYWSVLPFPSLLLASSG